MEERDEEEKKRVGCKELMEIKTREERGDTLREREGVNYRCNCHSEKEKDVVDIKKKLKTRNRKEGRVRGDA